MNDASKNPDSNAKLTATATATGDVAAHALIARDLVKEYQVGDQVLQILRGVSFQLAAGQNAAIVGPSGCGKSTLLYLLGTLEIPTSGEVELSGEFPFQLSAAQLAAFRNRSIGFVFQDHHLMPQLNVQENVLLPALAAGSVTPTLQERAAQLIEQVGLSHRLHQLPARLSGGERQRVAVARALLLRPQLILADEPTGSLDEGNSDKIADLLLEMQQQEQSMMLCVTHSPALAARFQRTLHLQQGQLIS